MHDTTGAVLTHGTPPEKTPEERAHDRELARIAEAKDIEENGDPLEEERRRDAMQRAEDGGADAAAVISGV